MADRQRLASMTQLLAVQRARRSSAEIILVEARQAEAKARDAERMAILERDEAVGDWTTYVEKAGFSPEHSRMLATLLIERDHAAGLAGGHAEAATQLSGRREQEWRTAEAQVRAGTAARRRLDRKLARRDEEKGLAALADRVTRSWRPS